MKIQQLTDQDASFLYLETSQTPQHVGGVSLVELPAGYEGNFYEDYKAHIARRMPLIPLMHRKLLPLPFDIDHPLWAEDPNVDINYHVRSLSLPKPGTFAQLEDLVGRLHSNFLDRSRPLWEFYVLDGLQNGNVAIYTKIHHSAMDGAASQVLITTMYDPTPEPRDLPIPEQHGGAQGAALDIETFIRGIATHIARNHIRAAQYLPDLWKAWAKVALPDVQTLRYDHAVTPPPPTPITMLNKAITSQRSYAARTLPLRTFKKLAKATGCKVNDVILAVCSGALRRYLSDHDGMPAQTMNAMVPVSLHEAGDQSVTNKNYVMVCTLASDIPNPYDRLMAIRQSTAQQKQLVGDIRNVLVPDLSLIGTGALVRTAVDLYYRSKISDRIPPLANLTISNVPGPPIPLYIAGAKLLTMYPCSIPFHGNAVNITVESYCDSLDFGLIACRTTVPDLPSLADYIVGALDELGESVDEHLAHVQHFPDDEPATSRSKSRQPAATRKRKTVAARTDARRATGGKSKSPSTKAAKKPAGATASAKAGKPSASSKKTAAKAGTKKKAATRQKSAAPTSAPKPSKRKRLPGKPAARKASAATGVAGDAAPAAPNPLPDSGVGPQF